MLVGLNVTTILRQVVQNSSHLVSCEQFHKNAYFVSAFFTKAEQCKCASEYFPSEETSIRLSKIIQYGLRNEVAS